MMLRGTSGEALTAAAQAGRHAAGAAPSVAIVLKGYPRLSETFIAQEILALEARGLRAVIVSLRHPTEAHVHPVHRQIRAAVHYLPEYLYQEPRRVLLGFGHGLRLPGLLRAGRAWLRDLARDPSPGRARRFGQALVLARELPASVRHLHVHFLHTPASVTRYAALMLGLPWSCSAHAKDIWTLPPWEKAEKLSECRWLVTCTASNHAHLRALAPVPERVGLVYHGLDFARFPEPPRRRAGEAVVILSVGRAVAKKGYEDLLDALAALPRGRRWRFVHVGAGPLLGALRARAERLGIAGRVSWQGALPQAGVLAHYRAADLFVLACRVGDDGDRDGLPNVLLEAQSQKLACLSTRISGIPELIEHERTGLLVPAGDVAGLACALDRLIGDAALRARLGEAGFRRVHRHFSLEAGIERLAPRFGLAPGAAAIPAATAERA